VSARVYVEGGGDHNKALQTLCRKGFSEFVGKSGLKGRMPRIVACGGRRQAFESFRIALRDGANGPVVLLVDSEGPVAGRDAWEHVRLRTGDGWERPPGASDDHLHLMVQTMEAWFYGDLGALQAFYGRDFRESALSQRTDIEAIPKDELLSGLLAATKDCQKGRYSKGEHSFQILGKIDSVKVRAASPECERFLHTLEKLCL
jgi:hypothetical protein